MQELLKGQFEDGVTVKQLDAYTDDRIVLKEIKMSGETKIVVDCSPQKTMKLLKLVIIMVP